MFAGRGGTKRIQLPSANEKKSYFPLRPEPLVGYKLSRVALGTRMRSRRITREKWTVTSFWSCAVACLTVVVVRSRRILNSLLPVRNIPKFKDRANWSCDTFQPMRRRACVYQQTNQNTIKHRCCDQIFSKQRTLSDKISHRFEALRHIFKTFHEAYTIF